MIELLIGIKNRICFVFATTFGWNNFSFLAIGTHYKRVSSFIFIDMQYIIVFIITRAAIYSSNSVIFFCAYFGIRYEK